MGVSKWERAFPQGARLLSFDGKTSRVVSGPFLPWIPELCSALTFRLLKVCSRVC